MLTDLINKGPGPLVEYLPEPDVAAESLSRSAICVAADLETAIGWTNRLAPEHLAPG